MAQHVNGRPGNPADRRQHAASGKFTAQADADTATVRARGDLDVLSVDSLWATIDLLINAGCYDLTLDLSALSSIDEAGLKLLAALQHSLLSKNGNLRIIDARRSVCEALQRAQITFLNTGNPGE